MAYHQTAQAHFSEDNVNCQGTYTVCTLLNQNISNTKLTPAWPILKILDSDRKQGIDLEWLYSGLYPSNCPMGHGQGRIFVHKKSMKSFSLMPHLIYRCTCLSFSMSAKFWYRSVSTASSPFHAPIKWSTALPLSKFPKIYRKTWETDKSHLCLFHQVKRDYLNSSHLMAPQKGFSTTSQLQPKFS